MHEILKIETKIYTIKTFLIFVKFISVLTREMAVSIWINLTIYIAVFKYYVNTRDIRMEI
jgi:hypothetical protein